MKKSIIAVLAVAALQAQAVTLYNSRAGASAIQFNSTSSSSLVAFDDYDSTLASGHIELSQFIFVGGVDVANKPVSFGFYGPDLSLANSFSITLPSAGIFVWTITLGAGFNIPEKGFAAMFRSSTDTSYIASWRGQSAAPTVGTNDINAGSWNAGYMRMEIIGEAVPEPTTMAALGAGALALIRRRRSK